MKKFLSDSPEKTEEIACALASHLEPGDVVAYIGGLGMGKTCFTRGLSKGLGFSGQVTSPTFDIINEYIGGRLPLYHFDMYRIETWEGLDSCGYFDYMESGGVLAIEWSENIENALPKNTIFVEFTRIDDTTREIVIRGERL